MGTGTALRVFPLLLNQLFIPCEIAFKGDTVTITLDGRRWQQTRLQWCQAQAALDAEWRREGIEIVDVKVLMLPAPTE